MNPVLYWNSILLEASRRDFTRGYSNAQQPGPIRTSRAMAIVHLAIHDAVAFRNNRNAAYLEKKGVVHGIGAVNGNVEDIIAGAAVTALKFLYPRFATFIDDSVENVGSAPFNLGAQIGNAVLAHRSGDGSDAPLNGGQPISPEYGEHRADPFAPGQSQLGPQWGDVDRFIGAAHQPLDPFPGAGQVNYLTDADYRQDFEEVRDYGAVGRNLRTAEQERIGVYWGYDGANNLGVPPRLYNQVARAVLASRPPLNLARTAELFAILNVAMADAGIDAWHYKYEHDLWRPVVGLRAEAAPDADPFWTPLGAPQTNSPRATLTPNFPAYPSGHATFGAALMQVLRLVFNPALGPMTLPDVLAVDAAISTGNPAPPVANESFEFVSDELDGIASDPGGSVRQRVEKTFASFAEAVWENSVSRVYLGVHWRFDGLHHDPAKVIGGTPLGLAIGEEAFDFFNAAPSLGGTV